MLVAFRGVAELVEVPDQPSPPSVQVERAATGHIDTQAADHAAATFDIRSADSFPAFTHEAPVTITQLVTQSAPALDTGIPWFAHFDAPALSAFVPSAITDIATPAAARGDLAGTSTFGDGGGGVARDGETIAPLALNHADYFDFGWSIVPSASAEYGDAHMAMAAADGADGFVFDVAAGAFTSDLFIV